MLCTEAFPSTNIVWNAFQLHQISPPSQKNGRGYLGISGLCILSSPTMAPLACLLSGIKNSGTVFDRSPFTDTHEQH